MTQKLQTNANYNVNKKSHIETRSSNNIMHEV